MGRRAKIKSIGRQQATVIRELVEKAAADALKSSGLEVKVDGTVRFDSATCTIKIQAFLPEEKAAMSEGDSQLIGFSKNIVGEPFRHNRTIHTITEINLNRPKFPISSVNARGTRYKWAARNVASMLLDKSIEFKQYGMHTVSGSTSDF